MRINQSNRQLLALQVGIHCVKTIPPLLGPLSGQRGGNDSLFSHGQSESMHKYLVPTVTSKSIIFNTRLIEVLDQAPNFSPFAQPSFPAFPLVCTFLDKLTNLRRRLFNQLLKTSNYFVKTSLSQLFYEMYMAVSSELPSLRKRARPTARTDLEIYTNVCFK